MFAAFEALIDPLRPHDDSTPPASLARFYLHYCRQVWPQLATMMAIGFLVAGIEAYIVRFVGALVDLMRESGPDALLREHGVQFLAIGALVLIGRPLVGLLHDLVTLQAIAPGMTNLIRWQTHRYVLRQSVSYFANDFAGRIASNIMQTGVSLRDSVVQVIDALWFVLVFVASSLAILGAANWRLAAPLVVWMVVYAGELAYFVPRIRRRSEALAAKRATLTGRIVDSYANIQTVKLFAHLEREDSHAKEALVAHTAAYRGQTRIVTLLNLAVSLNNSVLLVGDHRRRGRALAQRPGDARRSRRRDRARDAHHDDGDVGDVERDRHLRQYRPDAGRHADGLQAARVGRPSRGARPVSRRGALSGSRRVRFHYGRGARRDRRPDAVDRARREGWTGRPLRRGQVDAGQPAAALLRRRGGPHPDRRPGHRRTRRRIRCASRSAW